MAASLNNVREKKEKKANFTEVKIDQSGRIIHQFYLIFFKLTDGIKIRSA